MNPFVHRENGAMHTDHSLGHTKFAAEDMSSQHILAQSLDNEVSQTTNMTLLNNTSSLSPRKEGQFAGARTVSQTASIEPNHVQ